MSTQVQKPQLILTVFKNEEGPGALLNPGIMVCGSFSFPIVLYRDLSWTSYSSTFSITSWKIKKKHFLFPWVSTLLPRCGSNMQKCFSTTSYKGVEQICPGSLCPHIINPLALFYLPKDLLFWLIAILSGNQDGSLAEHKEEDWGSEIE